MATRKDVAKLAGVSPTSVSYYVNKSGYVSDEKKLKIQKAIDTLNYRPNLIAKSLRAKTNNQILLVCNEIRNPFHAELVYFTTKFAYENNYIMLFANVQDDAEYIEKMCGYQVSGIIFASNKVTQDQYNKIASFGIPAITITNMDWLGLNPNITQLKIDTVSAVSNMVDIITGKGHKKIAFLSGCPSRDNRFIDRKTRGFIEGLRRNGFSECDENIIYNITSSTIAYEQAKALFVMNNYPTAVMCANDVAAIGTLRAAYEAGLKVPDDVVVTGFDNTENSSMSIPSLTTIDVSVKMISQLTIDIMMKRIKGESQKNVIIPTKLIRRESM